MLSLRALLFLQCITDCAVFCCSKFPTKLTYVRRGKKWPSLPDLTVNPHISQASVNFFFKRWPDRMASVNSSTSRMKCWCRISRLYRTCHSLHAGAHWWMIILCILNKTAAAFSFFCWYLQRLLTPTPLPSAKWCPTHVTIPTSGLKKIGLSTGPYATFPSPFLFSHQFFFKAENNHGNDNIQTQSQNLKNSGLSRRVGSYV